MIGAGALRYRLTIQRQETVANDLGEQIASWTTLATVWAARNQLTLREINRLSGLGSAAEARFRIRYRSDLTIGMSVSCDGRRYDIIDITEVGHREGLDLFARAI